MSHFDLPWTTIVNSPLKPRKSFNHTNTRQYIAGRCIRFFIWLPFAWVIWMFWETCFQNHSVMSSMFLSVHVCRIHDSLVYLRVTDNSSTGNQNGSSQFVYSFILKCNFYQLSTFHDNNYMNRHTHPSTSC